MRNLAKVNNRSVVVYFREKRERSDSRVEESIMQGLYSGESII